MFLRQWLSACAALALLLSPASFPLAKPMAPQKADVRIVIDISGSMKKNDPQNLRRPALRLLVGLMPAGSRAGVWTFGRYVNMQVPLGQVTESWKKNARDKAGEIHSRGLFTNIEEALQRATRDWEPGDNRYRRDVVLLTDGMVDVSKDPAESAASRQRILSKVLPRLKKLGARVHTIALSGRADHELMKQLAGETDGWYEQVDDAERLQRVFLRIFEKVGKPDTLPLEDNRFKVDKSIKEVTLLIFRGRDNTEPTRIITPGGRKFSAKNPPPSVNWHQDEGYDLLTITRPEAGEWHIQAQVDPDNRVMVVTDLKMHTTDLPNRIALGERIGLYAHFSNHGRKITRKAFLKMLEVRSEHRVGKDFSEPQPLRDDGGEHDKKALDGTFSAGLGEDLATGNTELVITAEGRTFVRERRQTFQVRIPARLKVTEEPRDGRAGIGITLTPDTDVIKPESLAPRSWLEAADGSRAGVILGPDGAGGWQAWADTSVLKGPHQLRVGLSGVSRWGNPIRLELEPVAVEGAAATPAPEPKTTAKKKPAPPPKQADEPLPDWAFNAILFGIVNLILIGAGLGGYLFYRKRKSEKTVRLTDEDEAEDKNEKNKGNKAK